MANKTTLEFDLDDSILDDIEDDAVVAMWKTAEALHTDLIQSQTIPFLSGNLQNTATSVLPKKRAKVYRLVSATEYAQRLYEHPEFNFNKEENPDAGAGWFDPYIEGDKKDLALEYFTKFAKAIMEKG